MLVTSYIYNEQGIKTVKYILNDINTFIYLNTTYKKRKTIVLNFNSRFSKKYGTITLFDQNVWHNLYMSHQFFVSEDILNHAEVFIKFNFLKKKWEMRNIWQTFLGVSLLIEQYVKNLLH